MRVKAISKSLLPQDIMNIYITVRYQSWCPRKCSIGFGDPIFHLNTRQRSTGEYDFNSDPYGENLSLQYRSKLWEEYPLSSSTVFGNDCLITFYGGGRGVTRYFGTLPNER
jgi:hypothetical protein